MSVTKSARPIQTAWSLHRHLFIVDNMRLLKSLNDDVVDLIVTDPPFGAMETWRRGLTPPLTEHERVFERDTLAGWDITTPLQAELEGVAWTTDHTTAQYRDIWTWADVHQQWVADLKAHYPATYAVLEAARASLDRGKRRTAASMPAFLTFMAARLIEMHRVLKPTGSLFVHCDRRANSYLRVVLDSIFDVKQPTNEIVWQRHSGRPNRSQHTPRRLTHATDTIFHYAKSDDYVWNAPTQPLSDDEIEAKFPHVDPKRGRYRTDHALFLGASKGARPNLCYTYESPYGPVTNPHPSGWSVSKKRLTEMDKRGDIIWRAGKTPKRKDYLADYQGRLVGSLWDDIRNLTSFDEERTGYPTQKPVALAERIVAAASNEGGLVFDPFAGCAYVPVAAELLQRRWLACDISPRALTVFRRQYDKQWSAQTLPGVSGEPQSLDFNQVTIAGPPHLPVRTTKRSAAPPVKPLAHQTFKSFATGLSEAQERDLMMRLSDYRCWSCGFATRDASGKPLRTSTLLEYDHIVPRASTGLDGGDIFTNRAVLCRTCNGWKSDRDITINDLRQEERVIERRAELGVEEADLPSPRVIHEEMQREVIRLAREAAAAV